MVLEPEELGAALDQSVEQLPAGGLAGGQVPQPHGLVPRAGQGEVAVRGQSHVRDEVAMAVQPLVGRPVVTGVVP